MRLGFGNWLAVIPPADHWSVVLHEARARKILYYTEGASNLRNKFTSKINYLLIVVARVVEEISSRN